MREQTIQFPLRQFHFSIDDIRPSRQTRSLLWRKLLVAAALTPLMGFGPGSYVAHESTGKAEAAATAADVQRGRLLYETHCVACHTTQAHWRDKHIVGSWADLLYQVTRMQKNAAKDWSSTEISDVAAYLNEMYSLKDHLARFLSLDAER